MGAAWDGTDAASVAYFGDGATSEGDVNEALVFAASFDAPVVFFCQNNQWAISEPVGLQSKQPLARRADGFGMPGVRVDGNDVLAVLAATRIALDRARRGDGPTFIEAVTYRHRARTPPPTTRSATAPTTSSPSGARATRSRACSPCSARWASTPTRSSARSPTRPAAPPPSCARRSRRSPTPSR